MTTLKQYYIAHTDKDCEDHQLPGTWEAETPDEAIKQMLREAREEDDGKWRAWEVKDERDVWRRP